MVRSVAGAALLVVLHLAQPEPAVLSGTHTPGFVVVGVNASFRLTRRLNLTLFADNLTDGNYRWHGSGVDRAGASVQRRTRYEF